MGGLLFGDIYHVVSHHTDAGDGATGFVIRRGYLTFDADVTDSWYGRLRFELNQSGEFETYTFELSFKDLYAGWKVGRQRILFGLSPTPTFDLIESIWGFRYLVRTPMDLQGVASRDTGISAKGPINGSGTVSYRAMGGAGLQFGNETGDGKKWMGAIAWQPRPQWTFDLYLDYERLDGPTDRATVQVFAGYKTEKLRWGIQYSHQDRQKEPRLQLASGFVVRRVGSKITLVGRVDRIFEPSPRGDNIAYLPFDPSAPATFFIGGVEFRIWPYLYITPNTVVTTYDENDDGVRPKTDFHLRLTFFLDFEG
ncbi:MAG: hypothetical protein JSW50_13990 [Candidatus Latescibacterota bacterium]|nr:MAG: hypothetical protein JSW50_13990 [Candidatus Latescibacterota bacterium]